MIVENQPTSEPDGDNTVRVPTPVPQPTIGDSDEVDEGADLLFKSWLPLKWKKRKQVPDIHVDYRVEVVEEGEPSGLHFQAQVKGRSTRTGKPRKLTEPLKTKHLRYYLRCEEPVFLFLIDPERKQGNWLFIQRYLKERVPLHALKSQKTSTIQFDAEDSFENWARFEKTLHEAWSYMRDLHPGSPIAAVVAEKMRLEQLDPRFSVSISATSNSQKVYVEPRQPIGNAVTLKFRKPPEADKLKAFLEKGQYIQVKATDIDTTELPILSEILRGLGDAEITIGNCAARKGCLQFVLRPEGQHRVIQIDGEWVLAPRQISFTGQLPLSPLEVQLKLALEEDGKFEVGSVGVRFDWGAWQRQPLLSLAYFPELGEFIGTDECSFSCYVSGNRAWGGKYRLHNLDARKTASELMNWLQKCRNAAKHVGANPVFPQADSLNKIESDDVRLMIELIEQGSHEQVNDGQIVGISVGVPPKEVTAWKDGADVTFTETFREIEFFGMKLQFGPLSHKWTDMHLIDVALSESNRSELTLKGGSKSVWRIDYARADRVN